MWPLGRESYSIGHLPIKKKKSTGIYMFCNCEVFWHKISERFLFPDFSLSGSASTQVSLILHQDWREPLPKAPQITQIWSKHLKTIWHRMHRWQWGAGRKSMNCLVLLYKHRQLYSVGTSKILNYWTIITDTLMCLRHCTVEITLFNSTFRTTFSIMSKLLST